MEATLRVRMSAKDAHYAGNLVDGARVLALFGDVATELLIRHDGDEGLFVAYDSVTFKAPVYAGDFLEVRGRITRVGNTSRAMAEPVLVVQATGTCVVPKQFQRGSGGGGRG